ncbi:MAG: hypothetical protein V4580_18170 [Bacteroidota bacterium]
MTFIASVVAKDGIAVIADSLSSSMVRTITQDRWKDFLNEKKKEVVEGADFVFTEDEVSKLFIRKPSHTKDYENKLFVYDKYTTITTAGGGVINGKRIDKLVAEIKQLAQAEEGKYLAQPIEQRVDQFCKLLESEILAHIGANKIIQPTHFIISHYNKLTQEASIYTVKIIINTEATLKEDTVVLYDKEKDDSKVVCDGQSNISNRILYGGLGEAIDCLEDVVDSVRQELEKNGFGEEKGLPKGFYQELTKTKAESLFQDQSQEAHLFHLSTLSLQQASDLAFLLLKVERDFQAYTKDIPTVGGQVKLATINEDGVHFVLGKNIIKPTRHL